MELTSRFYKVDNKGRRQVESKDEYKKRGFKSPDYADACLLAFYEPVSYFDPQETTVNGEKRINVKNYKQSIKIFNQMRDRL
jgi:hypothetical protein